MFDLSVVVAVSSDETRGRFHFAVAVVVVVAVLVVVAVESAPLVLLIKRGWGGAEILLFERGNRASYKISRHNLLFIGR